MSGAIRLSLSRCPVTNPVSLFTSLFGKKQEGYTVTMPMQDVVKWCFTYLSVPPIITDDCDVRQVIYSDYKKPIPNIVATFMRTVSFMFQSHT